MSVHDRKEKPHHKLASSAPNNSPADKASVARTRLNPTHLNNVANPKTAQIMALQRQYGNQFTQKLLNRRPRKLRIQRYYEHTPGEGDATPAHFEAQQKMGNTFIHPETHLPNIQPNTHGGGGPIIPQLRVANDAQMAIETSDLSTRQAKVFFATQAIIDESNARLLEIDSPIQLVIDQPNAVTITQNSEGIAIPPQALGRVVPRRRDNGHQGTNLDLQAGPNCNEVAEMVTNQPLHTTPVLTHTATPNIADGFPEYRLARYIINRQNGLAHEAALANLNGDVPQETMNQISEQYSDIVQPNLGFAKEIGRRLTDAGATPYTNLQNHLNNYRISRSEGNNHDVAAAATLEGLPAEVLPEVRKTYDSAKINQLTILVYDAAMAVPLEGGAVFPNNFQDIVRNNYVSRRLLQEIPHNHLVNMVGHVGANPPTFNAMNEAYNAHVGDPPENFTVDTLLQHYPGIRLEYALMPYIRSRLAGDGHGAALAHLPGYIHDSVSDNLEAVYQAARDAYDPEARAEQLSNLLRALGVNQFAAPEIGQIFGAASTGLPNGDGEITNSKDGKKRHAGRNAWNSHYGTVVAKSGGDSITLENYARNVENGDNPQGATSEYYFQMYGTGAGQSWHEVWENSARPTMNSVTMALGRDKKEVWNDQLDQIPGFAPQVNSLTYAASLLNGRQTINDAVDTPAAKAAYYAALDNLITDSLQAHRLRASQVGQGGGVHNLIPNNLTAIANVADGLQVINEIDMWINTYRARKTNTMKIRFMRRAELRRVINRLVTIRNKINELVGYHQARRVG